MKTQDNKSSTLQAELSNLHGSDPVLDHLLKKGEVTRESYLAYSFPGGAPDPLPAELEAQLPKPLQSSALPTEMEADSNSQLTKRYLDPRALKARLDQTLASSPSPKPTPKK